MKARNLTKVFMVIARIEQKMHKGFIRCLVATIAGTPRYNKYYGDFNIAVFSTREIAEEFMNDDNNLPFDFHPKDCCIQEWKVDYENNWREWNKKE